MEQGEYIITEKVPLCGPVQDFIFRFLLGPLIVLVTIAICKLMPKAFSHITTNPALAKEPVYRIFGYLHIPIIIILVALCAYYFVSIYREKITLTNKAILQRNVFSTHRIAYKDITGVNARYESFNLNQKARVHSFILGLLLGVNWEVEINAVNNQSMHIKNMTKRLAKALAANMAGLTANNIKTINA